MLRLQDWFCHILVLGMPYIGLNFVPECETVVFMKIYLQWIYMQTFLSNIYNTQRSFNQYHLNSVN